jgi:hypothetical protein
LDDFKQAASDIQAATAATPTQLGSLFRSACISKERPSAACDRAEKAISGSYKGNLARRVGGICRVLGECDVELAGNSTCVLTAAGRQNGTLSECLVDGVVGGPAIDGIWAGTGEHHWMRNSAVPCAWGCAATSCATQVLHVLQHMFN